LQNKGILHIPIIDNNRVLIGLETLPQLSVKIVYENPVVIMAGGFGTRLHPLTKDLPKPLLKVGDKPILETILGQFINAGFVNFYFSLHYRADMVMDYFGNGSKWGANIQYVQEDKQLGTAGSLGLIPKNRIKAPIIIMNGDLLTKVNFKSLLEYHNEHDGIATMCVREYDFQVPFGVVEVKEQFVTTIKEKPVNKFLVNAGIYVLNPETISVIDGKGYLDMTNFLESQIKNGKKISTFPLHEYWLDIGRMDEYEMAHKQFTQFF